MSHDLLSQQSWRDQIAARTGGRAETLIAICDAFLQEVPDLVLQIQRAVDEQDPDGLKRASHTLKSCLSYVAVAEDVERAAAIEANSKQPGSITPDQLTEIDAISQRWLLCVQTLRDETKTALGQSS